MTSPDVSADDGEEKMRTNVFHHQLKEAAPESVEVSGQKHWKSFPCPTCNMPSGYPCRTRVRGGFHYKTVAAHAARKRMAIQANSVPDPSESDSASVNPQMKTRNLSSEGEQGEALLAIRELIDTYFATEFNGEQILSKIHELSRAPSSTVTGAQEKTLEKTEASADNAEVVLQKALRAAEANLKYWHGEYSARLRYMARALDEAEIWVLHVTATSNGETYEKANSSLQKIRSALQYRPSVLARDSSDATGAQNFGGKGSVITKTAETQNARSVQPLWCLALPIQQQSVLLLAARGPDGIAKAHPCKDLQRVYRGTVLVAARYGRCLRWGESADTFMGLDIIAQKMVDWERFLDRFFQHSDDLPHHFLMHLMHGAEILGYKHPEERFRIRWKAFYFRCVKELHLTEESMKEMDARLSDWRRQHWETDSVVLPNVTGALPVSENSAPPAPASVAQEEKLHPWCGRCGSFHATHLPCPRQYHWRPISSGGLASEPHDILEDGTLLGIECDKETAVKLCAAHDFAMQVFNSRLREKEKEIEALSQQLWNREERWKESEKIRALAEKEIERLREARKI